jgi:hypothetical protein
MTSGAPRREIMELRSVEKNCERNEARRCPRKRKDGLLRFARNDDSLIRNNSQQIALVQIDAASEW